MIPGLHSVLRAIRSRKQTDRVGSHCSALQQTPHNKRSKVREHTVYLPIWTWLELNTTNLATWGDRGREVAWLE